MGITTSAVRYGNLSKYTAIFYHTRRLKALLWLIAIVFGMIQTWANRNATNPDGISYLDLGDAYFRGDWGMVINGYWSPFYPWLLGLTLKILKPSPYWEYTVVHLVNFAIYLCTLVCFDFFLSQLIRYHHAKSKDPFEEGQMKLPEWAWLVLGYTIFLWSSLHLLYIRLITPDMCVAAFVYLACGILLRIRMGRTGWLSFFLFGVVLGFAYLAKSVMFLLALIFLAVCLFLAHKVKPAMPRALTALVGFLLIASPLVIALSKTKHRLTFGESGRLNYAWYVEGIRASHWQGEASGDVIFKHPPRKIFDSPSIYEFGDPIGGTYPLWYDASYWYEGVPFRFELKRQLKILALNVEGFVDSSDLRRSLIAGLFILFCMSAGGRLLVRRIRQHWFLLIPAMAALGVYALVYLEGRHIAPFLAVIFLCLFSSVRMHDSHESRKLLTAVTLMIPAMFILALGPSTWREAYAVFRDVFSETGDGPNAYWQVADGLKGMGIEQGIKVASLEYSNITNTGWARLARDQIVAEIYPDDDWIFHDDDSRVWKEHGLESSFWRMAPEVKNQIIEAFARAGANIIVAHEAPADAVAEGWQRIGNTRYYVYFLQR